jgi:glycine hydroxymethyltransferase
MEQDFSLISGGTDNHLMLLDFRNSELTGRQAQEALDVAHITTNCNSVPFDKRSPFVTSGLRIGTPAVTTRGMRKPEMAFIADAIRRALADVTSERALASIGDDVVALCRKFPAYPRRGYANAAA